VSEGGGARLEDGFCIRCLGGCVRGSKKRGLSFRGGREVMGWALLEGVRIGYEK
jgi:hypothetical protein